MEEILKIASYVCTRYEQTYGQRIDEMKLHKLLYLLQRETIIQTGEPMFKEKFQAWMYGPVSVEVRKAYREDRLHDTLDEATAARYKSVFDKVFDTYSAKDSYSLSDLTHCEYSYKKARGERLGKYDKCSTYIEVDDIKVDARRVRVRRYVSDSMARAQRV